MNTIAATTELTPQQQRFAERENATPGVCVADGVLFYRVTPEITYRWIVRRDGRCIDSATFLRR